GARGLTAASLNAVPQEIFFTSGGTEADNMALYGAAEARKRRGNKIITTQVEHPAVLETCRKLEKQGFKVVYLPVDENCIVDPDRLAGEIDDKTILISVMHVNNETGAIQPVQEIGRIKDKYNNENREKNTGIIFHTDAVQSYFKLKETASLAGTGEKGAFADMISVSGHKIHGPKGVGALYISEDLTLPAFMTGGGQEKGMRSGTENVAAIAGFGKAVGINMEKADEMRANMAEMKKYLLEGIRAEIKDIKVNGPEDEERACPSVLNVSFEGTRGEVILHSLEEDDIYVSTGSACSSHKDGDSHVLKAMGRSHKDIESALRFSFGGYETKEQVEFCLEKLKTAVSRFRKLGTFR
ncbi:MAG: cysteine desulfurase, partial [Firmicutes bacterium]|nr:cysteine desulfurase [Bacillota bacterium]